MERTTQRIVAIVVVAAIVTGGIVGAVVFIALLPGAEAFYVTPGVDKEDIKEGFMLKFGILGDMDEIWGDGAYEGAWLAAYEINHNGGIKINESMDPDTPNGTYYIGITKDDTDEQDPEFIASRATTAAERMVYTKEAQIVIGGSRTEALDAYLPTILNEDVLFIGTGAADERFTERVGELNAFMQPVYPEYQYFFRMMPINSSALSTQVGGTFYSIQQTLNATYYPLGTEIGTIGVLLEDLKWTEATQTSLPYAIANIFNLTLGPVKLFTPGASSAVIKGYLDDFTTAGCDIVVHMISGADGIKVVTQWTDSQKDYLLIGIDVQSQSSEFWDDTAGKCQYEIQTQAVAETNVTPYTLTFFSDYQAEFEHDPIYTASGSYDALKMIAATMLLNQTTSNDLLIPALEEWDKANPYVGVGGYTAFTSNHDLWAGTPPYGIALWTQWQAGAFKACINGPYYSYANINTSVLEIPPWIDDAWDTT